MWRIAWCDAADVVLLKDGQRLEGTIIAENNDRITLQIRSGGVTTTHEIARSRIERLERAGDGGKAAPAQSLRIDSAATIDELMRLSQEFHRNHDYANATKCIDKAVSIRPELLTISLASHPTMPAGWRDFWHDRVLSLRSAALAADDARARVDLARWAHQVGLARQARGLLTAALRIDPTLNEARRLAEQLGLAVPEPLRFDLRFALDQPILLGRFRDADVAISPRKNCVLALLPFMYCPVAGRQTISLSNLQVNADGGRGCRVFGIAILEGLAYERDGSPSLRPRLSLPRINEPLYERFDATSRIGSDSLELECYNVSGPVPPRAAAPAPAVRSGIGYAAFLVEIPSAAQFLECAYRIPDSPNARARLAVALLRTLPENVAAIKGPARVQAVNTLVRWASAPVPPASLAAVLKLGAIRIAPPGRDPDLPHTLIDGTLLEALRHADGLTRFAAWNSLIISPLDLPGSTCETIATNTNTDVLLALLAMIENTLQNERPDTQTPREGSGPAVGRLSAGRAGVVPAVPPYLADLPESPAHRNVFAALGAVLRCQHREPVARAIRIVLSDGTQQSVALLISAPAPVRKELIAALASIGAPALRAAVIRCILTQPDAEVVRRLAHAADDLAITIRDEQDPLLTALLNTQDRDARLDLLGLLARADLEAVAETATMRKIMDAFLAEQSDAELRRAACALLMAQWPMPPATPVPRSGHFAVRPVMRPTFAALALSRAAVHRDPMTHRPAAAFLVRAGQIEPLLKELVRADPQTQLAVAKGLAEDSSLSGFDALPMALAGLTASRDGAVQLACLQAIERLADLRPEEARWRVWLAVQNQLEPDDLLRLASGKDAAVAVKSLELLRQVAVLNAAQAQELALAGGRARKEVLDRIDASRAAGPAGSFACVVYADIAGWPVTKQPVDESRSGPVAAGGRALTATRRGLPLVAAQVTLSPRSDGKIGARTGTTDLGASEVVTRARSGAGGDSAALTLDVLPLLRSAFQSPEAHASGIAGKVQIPAAEGMLRCQVSYFRFGQWAGDIAITEPAARAAAAGASADGSGARQLRLVSARVVLMPLAPY